MCARVVKVSLKMTGLVLARATSRSDRRRREDRVVDAAPGRRLRRPTLFLAGQCVGLKSFHPGRNIEHLTEHHLLSAKYRALQLLGGYLTGFVGQVDPTVA